MPRYLKTRRHARKVDRVLRPLFPRYLFVRLDTAVDPWLAIRSTIGVCDFVRNGESPAWLADDVVDEIRARETDGGDVPLVDVRRLEPGAALEIIDGPFAERVGIFDRIDDSERVILLLRLMGRELKVRVPSRALAACA